MMCYVNWRRCWIWVRRQTTRTRLVWRHCTCALQVMWRLPRRSDVLTCYFMIMQLSELWTLPAGQNSIRFSIFLYSVFICVCISALTLLLKVLSQQYGGSMLPQECSHPSMLWHCWLGDRNCIRPVKVLPRQFPNHIVYIIYASVNSYVNKTAPNTFQIFIT